MCPYSTANSECSRLRRFRSRNEQSSHPRLSKAPQSRWSVRSSTRRATSDHSSFCSHLQIEAHLASSPRPLGVSSDMSVIWLRQKITAKFINLPMSARNGGNYKHITHRVRLCRIVSAHCLCLPVLTISQSYITTSAFKVCRTSSIAEFGIEPCDFQA